MFAANGSNEVLQTLLLTYGGPGRRVATFEPTYQLHGHIARLTGADVVEGERRDDFTLDLDEAGRAADLVPADRDVPLLAQQPDRHGRARGDGAGGAGRWRRACSWSTRRTASSRRGRPLDLLDEDRPLVVTRTFSKTWSMAAARLGYLLGPTWLVAELEKVVLPYHLDAAKQIAGRLALRFVDEMETRVEADRGRAGAPDGPAPTASGAGLAVGRQLRALPARRRETGERSGRACSSARARP